MAKSVKRPVKSSGRSSDVEPSRAIALDRAFIVSRLLDEKYFPEVSKAVRSNDKELFLAICQKAGIPEDMVKHIWGIVSTGYYRAYAAEKTIMW